MASTSHSVTSLHRSADTQVKACSACIDTFSRYIERTYVRKLESDLGPSAFHRPCLLLLRGFINSTIMAVHGNCDQINNQSLSPPEWIEQCCLTKYYEWMKTNPKQQISYENWKTSKNTKGLALYYAALHIWNEPDSDEEAEKSEVVSRSRNVQVQSAREPKKTLTTNGNGRSHAAGSATPRASTNSEELSASGKRRPRKQRKKYLSEEIVASDGSDHGEIATPVAASAKSSRTAVTFVEERKSSARKAKKKRLSEQIISPEDKDDTLPMTEIWSPNIPVRSAPSASAHIQNSEPLRKIVRLKVGPGRKVEKKVLSEDIVVGDDTNKEEASAKVATSVFGEDNAKTRISAKISLGAVVGMGEDPNTPAGSPEQQDESSATARRGLRMRRPTQQRPYLYDAQFLDEDSAAAKQEHKEQVEKGDEHSWELEEDARPTSRGRGTRRVSYASIIGIDDELLSALDEESKALLQEEDQYQDQDDDDRRPRHFKGKGRAWRKDESDEDLEFAPARKKAAKAKAQAGIVKKRGRPRKSAVYEDVGRDNQDTDVETAAGDSMVESSAPSTPVLTHATIPKKRGRPRKSVLSESVATYDSASEHPNASAPQTPSLPPKKRGRPRKSDQSILSKENNDKENNANENSTNENYSPQNPPSSNLAVQIPHASNPSFPDAIVLLDSVVTIEEQPPTAVITAAPENVNDGEVEKVPTASPSRKRKSASISVSDGEDHFKEEVVHDEASRDFAFDLLRGAGTLGGERKYHTKMQWN